MIRQLKTLTVNMVAGANAATVGLLLAAGYSDHLNPARWPLLSNLGMTFPVLILVNLLLLFFWLTFKWRRCWIPLAGFALTYVPLSVYMPLNLKQSTPDGTIKIISYNVCAYGGNYKYEVGFDTVYSYLKRQDADIVCLQEDVDTWRGNVFARYSKIYPHNDTTLFSKGSSMVNGVGIHTRFPILRKERIGYASQANGSVAYYLLVGTDTVLVINNHLETTHLSSHDRLRYKEIIRGRVDRDTARAESLQLLGKLGRSSAIRAPQAEAVRAYIDAHRQYPLIVCGDFNDNPISYARRTIAKNLTDCYAETGRGVGLSYNQKGFFFRIDHLFCSSHFTPYNAYIDSKMDASDHYPLICRLKRTDNP